jgi:hypothetical protein
MVPPAEIETPFFEVPMSSSRFRLWLGWGLACAFFGTTAFLAWQQLRPGPGVTAENLAKIKEGMPVEEVERILGPGRPGHGPLLSSQLQEAPKSAVWKHWTRLKTGQEGWEDVYVFAFVNGRLAANSWATSRPVNPEPVRYVRQIFTLDKMLRPTMAGDFCLAYEYRGGFVDCWVEAVTGGKKETVGQISGQQLRKNVPNWTVELENNTHGQIFWDPFSSGSDDLNLVVTATADVGQGLDTNFEIQRGVNQGSKKKWTPFWLRGSDSLRSKGQCPTPCWCQMRRGSSTLTSMKTVRFD